MTSWIPNQQRAKRSEYSYAVAACVVSTHGCVPRRVLLNDAISISISISVRSILTHRRKASDNVAKEKLPRGQEEREEANQAAAAIPKNSLNSIESPTSRTKQGFLEGKKEEDILLVYPFDGDEQLIEKAAEGLDEASRGDPYNADSVSERVMVEATEIDTTDPKVSDAGKVSSGGSDKGEADPETNTRGRAHFITVRVEDYERLEPGEFLNDTLIDFWMQWYVPRACPFEC
jgi:Ulp1 family protease